MASLRVTALLSVGMADGYAGTTQLTVGPGFAGAKPYLERFTRDGAPHVYFAFPVLRAGASHLLGFAIGGSIGLVEVQGGWSLQWNESDAGDSEA